MGCYMALRSFEPSGAPRGACSIPELLFCPSPNKYVDFHKKINFFPLRMTVLFTIDTWDKHTSPPHQSILNFDYLELNNELEVLLDLLCDLALEDWLLDLCSLEDLLTLDELLDDLEFVKELKDLQFSFFCFNWKNATSPKIANIWEIIIDLFLKSITNGLNV